MAYAERPLENPINWSFRIGRMFGIDVRIHLLLILGFFVVLGGFLPKGSAAVDVSVWTAMRDALCCYAIIFLSVLLHEFGHCFGARAVGGEAHEVLLWPLGGLASVSPPHTPRANLITTLAGPAVNFVLFLTAAAGLIVWTGNWGAVPWNPLHPMTPLDEFFFPTTAQWWLMVVFAVNYTQCAFNMLLPTYPLDGGRTLQAILWRVKGYHASMELACSVGMIGAVGLALVGVFSDQSWLFISMAAFGYITCWNERRMLRETGGGFETGEFGYDFSRGYSSLGKRVVDRERNTSWFARYRARKAALRAERERQKEATHAAEVERLLEKVFQSGLHSLTPKERRILEQETQRKRSE